jgi:hypothetical protein
MEAMAKTFRYLDQEELDNQRAAKKKVLADKAKAEAKAAEDKK